MLDEEKRQRYRKVIKEFCLMDDIFMSAVYDNNIELTEELLKVILENDKIKVVSSKAQYCVKNLVGHSAVLDIFAQDEEGNNFNVEVQRVSKGAIPKRARYYTSVIDAKHFDTGNDYEVLKDTYVVFITEQDVLGEQLPIYHIRRKIDETGTVFEDGSHIIYVNGERRYDKTPLGELMHDFFCKDAKDMLNKKLAARVSCMKEEATTMTEMCEIMQRLADQEAVERVHKTNLQNAERLLKAGATIDMVVEGIQLTREEVEEIAKRIA